MSERDEFEACPFCGCTDSPVQRGNGIGDVWLECAQCEASTRLRENIETCAKDWNRRATPQQAVPALRPDVIADLIWRHTGLSEEQFPDAYGDSVSLVKAVLAEVAAPQPSQEPEKAEPVNWYPADSHNPESAHCGCRGCIRELDEKHPIDQIFTREATRMIVCKKCGNKRCPHANDHRNACTGSNEPGQPGSAY